MAKNECPTFLLATPILELFLGGKANAFTDLPQEVALLSGSDLVEAPAEEEDQKGDQHQDSRNA